jgi:hydrogenase maturation factor
MFTSVPDDLVGQFDVVHVRLVTLVIKDDDAAPLIANLHRLLSAFVPPFVRRV